MKCPERGFRMLLTWGRNVYLILRIVRIRRYADCGCWYTEEMLFYGPWGGWVKKIGAISLPHVIFFLE